MKNRDEIIKARQDRLDHIRNSFSNQNELIKGKPAQIGEIREHGGKKMKKTPQGWVPAGDGKKDSFTQQLSEKVGRDVTKPEAHVKEKINQRDEARKKSSATKFDSPSKDQLAKMSDEQVDSKHKEITSKIKELEKQGAKEVEYSDGKPSYTPFGQSVKESKAIMDEQASRKKNAASAAGASIKDHKLPKMTKPADAGTKIGNRRAQADVIIGAIKEKFSVEQLRSVGLNPKENHNNGLLYLDQMSVNSEAASKEFISKLKKENPEIKVNLNTTSGHKYMFSFKDAKSNSINPSKLTKKGLYDAVNKKYGTSFKPGSIEEFEDSEFRTQLDPGDISAIVEDEK
jgi:hypothetical protein